MLYFVEVVPHADSYEIVWDVVGFIVLDLGSSRLEVADYLRVRLDCGFLRDDSLLQIVDVVLLALERVELLRPALVVLLPFAERDWDGIAVVESPLPELSVVVFQLVYSSLF